jgi:hypothetical protein
VARSGHAGLGQVCLVELHWHDGWFLDASISCVIVLTTDTMPSTLQVAIRLHRPRGLGPRSDHTFLSNGTVGLLARDLGRKESVHRWRGLMGTFWQAPSH